MKTAAADMPVYSNDGSKLIGQLKCGQDVAVLSENGSGAVIAYITGLIKKQDCLMLVDAEEWGKTTEEIVKFLAYTASRVGCLYVSGAQGQQMTPALIRKLEKNYSNYKRALNAYNKHALSGKTLIAYDCSGLIIAYLLGNKLIKHDLTANGIYYTICNSISKGELRGGDFVFKKRLAGSRIYHTGVYMGDGTVVHSKGRDYGVVREALSKTGWNRFGRLKVFANGKIAPAFSRMLKKAAPYMRGDDVREVQEALLYEGHDPKGQDGVFGPKTEEAVLSFQKAAGLKEDGAVGRETWDKLVKQGTTNTGSGI